MISTSNMKISLKNCRNTFLRLFCPYSVQRPLQLVKYDHTCTVYDHLVALTHTSFKINIGQKYDNRINAHQL